MDFDYAHAYFIQKWDMENYKNRTIDTALEWMKENLENSVNTAEEIEINLFLMAIELLAISFSKTHTLLQTRKQEII